MSESYITREIRIIDNITMPGEDLCEYLFNHLNGLTRALANIRSAGNAVDAEGLMPSTPLPNLDFNTQQPQSAGPNNYGMVYFVMLLFAGFLLMSLFSAGRQTTTAKRPIRVTRRDSLDREDNNDPLN